MNVELEATLPTRAMPRFPDRCVSCGIARPGDSTVVLAVIASKKIHFWPPRRRFKVVVPACAQCRAEMEHRTWMRRIGYVVGVALALAWGVWTLSLPDRHGFGREIFHFGLLALVIPFFCWDMWFLSPVLIQTNGSTVTYAFFNAQVAQEFIALNVATPNFDFDGRE